MTIKVDPIHDFSKGIVDDFAGWEKTLVRRNIFAPLFHFIESSPTPLLTVETAAALGADPSMSLWELVTHRAPSHAYASSLYNLWDDKIIGRLQELQTSLLPQSQNWLFDPNLEAAAIERSKQEATWLGSWLTGSRGMFRDEKHQMYLYNQWFARPDNITHDQLKLALRSKLNNTHCLPELDRGLTGPIRTALELEYKACQSAEQLNQRSLMLMDAARTVYSESSTPSVTEPRVLYPPTTILETPRARLSRLVGCLGFVASAVPICLLFYQLSKTDNQFEVAKNFVHDMAISSLIPSFSAAMVYEGAKWMFSEYLH